MSEKYISLRGEKAEAFESVQEDMGPDGVDYSNSDVVMLLIEEWEDSQEPTGGLTQ